MTNTIPNVPRELKPCPFCGDSELLGFEPSNEGGWTIVRCRRCGASGSTGRSTSEWEAAAYWNRRAPSPSGVDGPVRNFKTREGYDVWDKLCAIPKFGFLIGPSGGVVKVADIGNWIDRDEAQSVVDEAQCEVNLLRHEASDAQAIIDGLRGENERIRLNIAEYNEAISCYQSERDQQAQRIGELEGLLRHAQKQVPTGSGLHMRIDAALSAVCAAAPNIAPTSEHSSQPERDPCPMCIKGGICNTPTCGRLLAMPKAY